MLESQELDKVQLSLLDSKDADNARLLEQYTMKIQYRQDGRTNIFVHWRGRGHSQMVSHDGDQTDQQFHNLQVFVAERPSIDGIYSD